MPKSATELAEEFCQMADSVLGTYLDASVGMGELARGYMAWDSRRLDQLKNRTSPVDPRELNPAVAYVGSDGEEPEDIHVTNLHALIRRNVPDGANWKFLANMCVVALFQYWDDGYRAKLAESLAVQPSQLKSDVLGELRHLRRSIIHNGGRALPEVARAKYLKRFAVGESIDLDSDDVRNITKAVKKSVMSLLETPTVRPNTR